MKIFKFAFVAILLTIAVVKSYHYFMSEKKILKIWSPRVPFSVDPLEYDALAHHICFRSVYSSLISEYKLGEFQGALAERWESNGDKSQWTFYIRSNLKFANGDVLSAREVAFSLNRAALLMNRKGSESGLFEFLVGRDQLISANKLASGITFEKNAVQLSFDRPMPDLLTKIGFGLYAIVHPSDYDSESGSWKNSRQIIASGPYQIETWNETNLILVIRNDFPKNLLLKKPIERAVYTFSPEKILESDLVVDFDDSLALDQSFKFFGPVKSAIRYVVCESWQVPGSICHDKENRLRLRDQFYKGLDDQNFKHAKSFFPLAIHGIREMNLPTIEGKEVDLNGARVTISKVNPANKNAKNKDRVTPQEAFEHSISRMSSIFNFKPEIFVPPPTSPLSGNVDIRFRMTAVLVDSPHHDVQFMFLSQQGIKLPDETGEIKKYVRSATFSVQKVNEMMWDQAIVWPMGHMALGIWKKEDSFSLNSYNLVLPPLDLQWIEWE